MSYVIAAPEMMTSAATDLATIGSDLSAAHTAAAAQTTGVLAAAEDEVSTAIAALFSPTVRAFRHWCAAGGVSCPVRAGVEVECGLVCQRRGPGGEHARQHFAAPPITPVPATGNPTFTGTPSLLTRFGDATLLQVVAGFFKLPVVGNQLVTPGSPLLSLFANTSNIPGLSLLVGDSPPKFLPLLLGETVQHTTYDGMPVVQITPAHPDGDYVVAIHGGGIFQPLIFHWIDYSMMAYRRDHRIADLPVDTAARRYRRCGGAQDGWPDLLGDRRAGASHVSVLGDSAGGSIALASVEYLVANNETVPASMVLLSPVVDNSWSNPDIASIRGSWLPPTSTMQQLGKEWAGNLPINNYEVSPLYGPLNGLPPTTVYAGSQDVVAPDVLVLQQEAVAQGAPISFVLANGETHDWLFVTPDTLHYWPQIDQELGI